MTDLKNVTGSRPMKSGVAFGHALASHRSTHKDLAGSLGAEKIRIRPIWPQDRQRYLEFFQSLSPTTNAFRFLALKKRISEEELSYLTEPDNTQHVALVAVMNDNGRERIVGAARFIMLPDGSSGSDHAELAVTVADEFQGKGIGARLVMSLIALARKRGVRALVLYASPGNTRVWRLVKRIAERASRRVEEGIVKIVVSLP
jgi:GNAT superfamily N-acetyltransferase